MNSAECSSGAAAGAAMRAAEVTGTGTRHNTASAQGDPEEVAATAAECGVGMGCPHPMPASGTDVRQNSGLPSGNSHPARITAAVNRIPRRLI